jgi:MazG family protein
MSTQSNKLLAEISDQSLSEFDRLVRIMEILRSPEGCAWDRKQDHRSLLPYLIEEAYEVVETIEAGDIDALKEELGDLICQVVFHAQIAKEANRFTVEDSVKSINDKLIRRHPHVFAENADLTPEEVRDQWETIKVEKGEKNSVLGGLPKSMPALTMAFRMGEKAGGAGFDWENAEQVIEKIDEEVKELKAEIESGDCETIEEEVGDLLFAVSSLARKLDIEPEVALRKALSKFRARFERLEQAVRSERGSFNDYSLEQLESIWQRQKEAE